MRRFEDYSAIELDELRKQGIRTLTYAYKCHKKCTRCAWSTPRHLWLSSSFEPGSWIPLNRIPQKQLIDELTRRTLLCALCRRRMRPPPQVRHKWSACIKRHPCVECNQFDRPGWSRADGTVPGEPIESHRCTTCKTQFDQRVRMGQDLNRRQKQQAGHCALCAHTVEEWGSCGFDWDHLDPQLKKNNVSTLVMEGHPLHTIRSEIAKCRLLCVYCHIDWTTHQLGYSDPVNNIRIALANARIRLFNATPLDLTGDDE